MPLSTSGATAQAAFSTKPTEKDPYRYQVGFGNNFASEALCAFFVIFILVDIHWHPFRPGVLPEGQNSPQKNKYGLYNEGVSLYIYRQGLMTSCIYIRWLVLPSSRLARKTWMREFTSGRGGVVDVWLTVAQVVVSYQTICRSRRIYSLAGQPRCMFWSPLIRTYRPLTSLHPRHFTSSHLQLESNFLPLNKKVHVSPTQLAWLPFKLPSGSEKVDWVDGIKTIAGNGDPTLREGMAIHVYLANTSMDKKAFCNGDGDMMILPQQGRLDIQTEFGKWVMILIHTPFVYFSGVMSLRSGVIGSLCVCVCMSSWYWWMDVFFFRIMVRPGELCVIQRGMKFKVSMLLRVNDWISINIRAIGHSSWWSFSRMWIRISFAWYRMLILLWLDLQEIFGTHYSLPELGPLGGNGLANPRDFETPVACFDIDQSPWEIIYKWVRNLYPSISRYWLYSEYLVNYMLVIKIIRLLTL